MVTILCVTMCLLSGKIRKGDIVNGSCLPKIWLQPQSLRHRLRGFFSVCGIMTAGCRNRMKKSLGMRVFLKLNKHILAENDFSDFAAKLRVVCWCLHLYRHVFRICM